VFICIFSTSLWGHGNHGGARRVVVANCLVNKNEVRIFNFKDRTKIYFVHFVLTTLLRKHALGLTTDLLTEFDGVQEGRIQHTDRSRNFTVRIMKMLPNIQVRYKICPLHPRTDRQFFECAITFR